MTTTFRGLFRFAFKAITWIAFLAVVGVVASMIMAYGETAQSMGDFLATITVGGVLLIGVAWLSGK